MYFIAENLREKFDNISIDVSFECEKGTMTSIVGASGSGKSTVLRLICGLDKPEPAQKIILDGIDITGEKPAKRKIGMVFQNHSLFNHLRVDDNVAYGLVSSGMRKKEARIVATDFLKAFGLAGFEKRYPNTLSGGEAQRVSLARTLIMKPKLVLFDEPLSALDAPLRKKLASLILTLQKTFDFTGIMVTHDINEAKAVSDKIILMKNGKIFWSGKSKDFDEKMMEDDFNLQI
ncbi:MAG: ABC transporter ATP-binding protein [Treponema sp.]|jgi:ABC-type Fe3+/spermidine/putrescine transport system ATPase subunit|nr:ABC transporter ATP-binding protein [Treponema sp.]